MACLLGFGVYISIEYFRWGKIQDGNRREQDSLTNHSTRMRCSRPPVFQGFGPHNNRPARPSCHNDKSEKGVAIFHKGDIGSKLYAVRAGAVRIVRRLNRAKTQFSTSSFPANSSGKLRFSTEDSAPLTRLLSTIVS